MAKRKTKRAARGEGVIRQRSDGRWEYLYYDKAGDRKSSYGKSQAEVYEKKKAIQAALHEGTYVDPSSYTVSTWADYFFEELYLQPNLNTRANVISHINNHIKPFFKSMRLQDVDQDDVLRFKRYLFNKNLSAKTVRNIHGTLHLVFQSAIPKRIKFNPAAGSLNMKGYAKPEMRVFSETEQFVFEDALEHSKLYESEKALYVFALLTGMRLGELLGLDWPHVDFSTGTVYIHQQLKRITTVNGQKELPQRQAILRIIDEQHYLALPKHGIKRQIKPGSIAIAVLKKMQVLQTEERLRTGLGDNYNPEGFVFVHATGQHLVGVTLLKHFKVLAAVAGAPEMRIHDLRHTYSRNSLLAGNTFDQISEALGHASIDFTKKQYGHFPEALHEKTGQNMDAYERQRQAKRTTRDNKNTQAT